MFICMQKINFITHFFIILSNLVMPGHTHLNESMNLKKLLTSTCRQKNNSVLQVFFDILQSFANLFFWILWGCLATHTQSDLVENFLCLSAGKKSTSPSMLLWSYCNDMQTSNFGYFGHAWLHTPN